MVLGLLFFVPPSARHPDPSAAMNERPWKYFFIFFFQSWLLTICACRCRSLCPADASAQRHIHPNQPHARQSGNYSKRLIRSVGSSGPVGAQGLCKMVQPDTVTQCRLDSGSRRLPIGLQPTGRVTRAVAWTRRLKFSPSKAVASGQRAMCCCDTPLWGHQEWNPFEQLDRFSRSGRPLRQPLN